MRVDEVTGGRRRGLLAVQILVSAGLLVWIFSREGFRGDLLAVAGAARPGWLVAGAGVAGVVQGLCLLRWRIFLRMAGMPLGWRESVGLYFGGAFGGLFLPGGAGGDLVKIGLMAARGRDAAVAALSVLMDRLCGSLSMILTGAGLIVWEFEWLTQGVAAGALVRGVLVYLGVLVAVIGLSVGLCALGLASRLPQWWPGRARLIDLTGIFARFFREWRTTVWAVALSCVMLGLYFFTFYCAARAYGVELPVARFLALMPAVDILAGLPVSLGGLGVRESAFVLMLGQLAGVGAPVAVMVSLAGYLMSVLWALPGAFLWIVRGPR